MIDKMSAFVIAQKAVDELSRDAHDSFEIVGESTIEVEDGWLFFYNTADFVRTRDLSDSLAGNGPVFVRRDGQIHHIPSYASWEVALKELRKP